MFRQGSWCCVVAFCTALVTFCELAHIVGNVCDRERFVNKTYLRIVLDRRRFLQFEEVHKTNIAEVQNVTKAVQNVAKAVQRKCLHSNTKREVTEVLNVNKTTQNVYITGQISAPIPLLCQLL
jgi:hypothetical protein